MSGEEISRPQAGADKQSEKREYTISGNFV
jgi:hypothetical protein